jgi:hypothetical protein
MYGFVAWFLYLSSLSNNGFLNDFTLPPKLPLFVVIPILLVVVWYSKRPYVLKTIKPVPVERFIYIQAFRILVELLIWGAFLQGIFPEIVTFNGMNFDIWVGVSALVVGYLAQKNKISKTLLIAWNVLGMLVLAFTIFQFINYYFLSDYAADVQSERFTKLPYLFLPAVFVPIAVFYHLLSIRQQLMEGSHTS